MIKLVTVVGARPQIIKAAAVNRAIRTHFADKIQEVIVHTGQHYDEGMSKVFFDELGLPKEDYNLGAGSGSHAVQTSAIMIGIEEILLKEKPHALLLYGDTNSTLAAAIAAAKIHLPVIHVEGGVRSYNKDFPEEINRLICDHLSTLVFVPTQRGVENLYREGFGAANRSPFTINNPKIYFCGDIMYDNSLFFSAVAAQKSDIISKLNLSTKRFSLVTMHRPSNVDDPEVLAKLFGTFHELAEEEDTSLVIPLHPRTMKLFETQIDRTVFQRVKASTRLRIIPAVSFLEMILLEKNAEIIITDSGGVQKEAYYFQRPCVIMLEETPWVELIESGTALLAGSNGKKIREAYKKLLDQSRMLQYPPIFGDGKAASFICEKIIENFG
jgi:UDP-GlcNAc3NAcA epimerase